MADLDTPSKRASAIGFDLMWYRVWPIPDGDLSTINDRQHMAYKYAGTLTVSTATGMTYYRTLLGVGV